LPLSVSGDPNSRESSRLSSQSLGQFASSTISTTVNSTNTSSHNLFKMALQIPPPPQEQPTTGYVKKRKNILYQVPTSNRELTQNHIHPQSCRSTNTTTPTTPRRPRPRPNPRSLAGRSVSRYLNEPPRLGNTLVALPSGTEDVSAATMSHEERVVDELAKLTLKLP
jgi:hypothetical protein